MLSNKVSHFSYFIPISKTCSLIFFFRFVFDFNMEEIDPVSTKVNVAYYISMAIKKELSWNALAIFFNGFKLTNDQYKNIVKLLLKELHQLQDQLQSKQDPIKAQETESILKAEIETDIPSEANDQEILDHFEKEVSVGALQNDSKPFALEHQTNRVIDNEYYTFIGDDNAALSDILS